MVSGTTLIAWCVPAHAQTYTRASTKNDDDSKDNALDTCESNGGSERGYLTEAGSWNLESVGQVGGSANVGGDSDSARRWRVVAKLLRALSLRELPAGWCICMCACVCICLCVC